MGSLELPLARRVLVAVHCWHRHLLNLLLLLLTLHLGWQTLQTPVLTVQFLMLTLQLPLLDCCQLLELQQPFRHWHSIAGQQCQGFVTVHMTARAQNDRTAIDLEVSVPGGASGC